MKRLIVFLAVLFCLVSTFGLSYDEVLTDINNKRVSLIATKEEETVFKSLLNNIEKNKNILTAEEVNKLLSSDYKKVSSVTRKQALEDIDLLFRDLKYAYNGYLIYGGDSVFGQKQKELENTLLKNYGNTIETTSLSKEIYNCLSSFITDFHFQFGGYGNLSALRYCYFYSNQYYKKDSNGFYKTEDGKKLYVDSYPQDVSIEYTLLEDGSFCYSAVCFALFDNSLTRTIVYKDQNGKKYYQNILFSNNSITNVDNKPDVQLITKDNVAYMFVRSFNSSNDNDPFIKTAKACAQADILIIDLRGNQGGSGSYEQWLDKVFGAKPNASRASAFNKCPFGMYDYKASYGNEVQEIEGIIRGSILQDDKKVFVLTDDNCASGGDMFANFLSFKQNSIQIGSNTMGCVCFGGYHEVQHLPNSGISFEFGPFFSSLRLGKIKEGQGVMPDVLCNTSIALEATMNLLVNENLVTKTAADYIVSKATGTNSQRDSGAQVMEKSTLNTDDGQVFEYKATLSPEHPVAFFLCSTFKNNVSYRIEITNTLKNQNLFFDTIVEYKFGTYGADSTGGKCQFANLGQCGGSDAFGYISEKEEEFEPFEVIIRFVPYKDDTIQTSTAGSLACNYGETRLITDLIESDPNSIKEVRYGSYIGSYKGWTDNIFK